MRILISAADRQFIYRLSICSDQLKYTEVFSPMFISMSELYSTIAVLASYVDGVKWEAFGELGHLATGPVARGCGAFSSR